MNFWEWSEVFCLVQQGKWQVLSFNDGTARRGKARAGEELAVLGLSS